MSFWSDRATRKTAEHYAYEKYHKPTLQTLVDQHIGKFTAAMQLILEGEPLFVQTNEELERTAQNLFRALIAEKAGLAFDRKARTRTEKEMATCLTRFYCGDESTAHLKVEHFKNSLDLTTIAQECEAIFESQAQEYLTKHKNPIARILSLPTVGCSDPNPEQEPLKTYITTFAKHVLHNSRKLQSIGGPADLREARKAAAPLINHTATFENTLYVNIMSYLEARGKAPLLPPPAVAPYGEKAASSLQY